VARIDPPDDWQSLKTREDWKAHRGGLLVVHNQRNPLGGEAPTKYHGRNCPHVPQVPDKLSARRGGAVACQHCGGE
jgi:hypothetical protein